MTNDLTFLPQILDISMGLEYLHSEHIVHGDLKGVSQIKLCLFSPVTIKWQANILVTASRRACIIDFGLASIVTPMEKTSSELDQNIGQDVAGTIRWMAPELLRGDSVSHFGSDIYAFGCVCFEVRPARLSTSWCPTDWHLDRY